MEIPYSEVSEHFATGEQLIHSAAPEAARLDWYVFLRIVVNPKGFVTKATPVAGQSEWYEKAALLAKTWRYIPFERDGRPVSATFVWSVNIVPPERRPAEHVAFPAIRDWNSLRMTLRRSGCLGTCPAYQLTVFGDGQVVYNGYGYVHYCGEYRGHLKPEVVRQLADSFQQADYFNLFDRYAINPTDLPTYTTSIEFDDKSKSVVDYWGSRMGMPEAVTVVEEAIDRFAGPKVWATGMNSHVECETSSIPVTPSDLPPKIK